MLYLTILVTYVVLALPLAVVVGKLMARVSDDYPLSTRKRGASDV